MGLISDFFFFFILQEITFSRCSLLFLILVSACSLVGCCNVRPLFYGLKLGKIQLWASWDKKHFECKTGDKHSVGHICVCEAFSWVETSFQSSNDVGSGKTILSNGLTLKEEIGISEQTLYWAPTTCRTLWETGIVKEEVDIFRFGR